MNLEQATLEATGDVMQFSVNTDLSFTMDLDPPTNLPTAMLHNEEIANIH